MRISDWSSDVCSSDLIGGLRFGSCRGRLPGSGRRRLRRDRLRGRAGAACGTGGRGGFLELVAEVDDRGRRRVGRAVLEDHPRRGAGAVHGLVGLRSEEHTSELQSLMRISYAVFCLKKKKTQQRTVIIATSK